MSLASLIDHPAPAWQLVVDGTPLSAEANARLMNLTHTDNRGFEADTLELELDDSDGQLSLPPRGAVIELWLGWQGAAPVAKGGFTVDEVAHNGTPDILSIRARSGDLAAGMTTQRERSWHQTTIGAIVTTIAEENGLKPAVAESLREVAVDHIDQTNESSASFLTRLAEQHDAIASIKAGRLLFVPLGMGRTASGQRIPAITITRQSGDRHQFTLADRNAYKAVRALYHDVAGAVKGEVIWGDEENAREVGQRPDSPAQPSAGQYKTLPGTATSRAKAQRTARKEWARLKTDRAARAAWVGVRMAYNDRNLKASGTAQYGEEEDKKRQQSAQRLAAKDRQKVESRPGEPVNAFERTGDNVKTLRHVYANKMNAQRAARAEWRRLQRGAANFSLTLAQGLPELMPETPATVRGWKPEIDSTEWIITRVVNSLTGDGGYTQRLELEIKAAEPPDDPQKT